MYSSRFRIAYLRALLGLLIGAALLISAALPTSILAQPFERCEPPWLGAHPRLSGDWFGWRTSLMGYGATDCAHDFQTANSGFLFGNTIDGLRPDFAYSAQDQSETSWFEQIFNNRLRLATNLWLPIDFFSLPGDQLFGATWSNHTYHSIDDAYLQYPHVALLATQDSLSRFWSFDQYQVYQVIDRANPTPGWETIGRAGIANDSSERTAWFLSRGVGGNSLIVSRPANVFGVGWYDASTNSQRTSIATSVLGSVNNGRGLECYYNYQWTPAIRLTPGVQAIMPAQESASTALIAGARAQLTF